LDMENNVFLTVQLCQSIMRDLNQDSQKQWLWRKQWKIKRLSVRTN
jgi:hypothetical protein